jgi:hypothetical protein
MPWRGSILLLLLTSALDGLSAQRHDPAELYPRGKDPRYPLIGGWVSVRAGLDTETNEGVLNLEFTDPQVVRG